MDSSRDIVVLLSQDFQGSVGDIQPHAPRVDYDGGVVHINCVDNVIPLIHLKIPKYDSRYCRVSREIGCRTANISVEGAVRGAANLANCMCFDWIHVAT